MRRQKSLRRKRNSLKNNWIFQVSGAALLGLALLGFVLWNQFQPRQQSVVTAFTIGDETVSTVTMNYYFRDAYDSFLGAYQEMSADVQLLDPSIPLDQQAYSEEGSWADVLFETALSNAARTEAICAEAQAQGYDYNVEAPVEAQLDALRQRASEQGYPSLTVFLQQFYGPTATEDTYAEYLRHTTLADSYSHSIFDATEDQAAWDAWFQERIECQHLELAPTARDGLYYAP